MTRSARHFAAATLLAAAAPGLALSPPGQVNGCGGNPASLTVSNDQPSPGDTVVLSHASGLAEGNALLFVGPVQLDLAGCGLPVPGGELLIQTSPAFLLESEGFVAGVGSLDLQIPAQPSLIGQSVGLQVVLFPLFVVPWEFTNAVELTFSP